MALTVRDLTEALSQLDPDAVVRFAYQVNYPLWGTIGGVAATDGEPEIFLLEDQYGESGYADSELWDLAVY